MTLDADDNTGDSTRDNSERRADGTYLPGHAGCWLPGESGNPGGRTKNDYSTKSRTLDKQLVKGIPWAEKLWRQLLAATKADTLPAGLTIGELLVHADKYHRATGKVGYLVEDNARQEGKVPDTAVVTHVQSMQIALYPAKPPKDWYKNVRALIGHQPGDPLLPGETEPTTGDNG